MNFIFIFIFSIFFIEINAKKPKKLEKIIINLDESPQNRWPAQHICTKYGPALRAATDLANQFLPDKTERDLAIDAAAFLIPFLGDYGQELVGFHSAPACSAICSQGMLVLLNLIYEVEAGCTSIVARQKDGHLIHGRNLDFLNPSALRELAIMVEFQQSNATVYHGVTYAGYFGLLTGMRPYKYSISLDQRQDDDKNALIKNLLAAISGGSDVPFLIRNVLAAPNLSYTQAVSKLAQTPLVTISYLIIAGVNGDEGAVITRNRDKAANVWSLNATRWFEVETNFDHWKPAGDNRRHTAIAAIEQIGHVHFNLSSLWTVLSTQPVLNTHTTYTTLMSAYNNQFEAWARFDAP